MFTVTPGQSRSVVRRLLVGIVVLALMAGAAVPVLAIGGSIAITLAEYDTANQVLSVEATSTSTTVTLTVSVASTGQVIGTLPNAGGGKYQGQFGWPVNPQSITVNSSGGGSASSAVTAR